MGNFKFVSHDARLINVQTDRPCDIIAEAARTSHAESVEFSDDKKFDRWDNINFAKKLLGWEHMTPFEFFDVEFELTTTRAVSHELVRHRLMSVIQQSQRYVAYKNGIYIIPPAALGDNGGNFVKAVFESCERYFELLEGGMSPEDARLVLPSCVATKMVVKMNLREFRHFLKLRTGDAAWSEMRILANKMKSRFVSRFGEVNAFLVESL